MLCGRKVSGHSVCVFYYFFYNKTIDITSFAIIIISIIIIVVATDGTRFQVILQSTNSQHFYISAVLCRYF